MSKLLVIWILNIISGFSIAQTEYNLPPGESVPQNFVLRDYSYKLDELTDSMNTTGAEKQDFLDFLNYDQLDSLKQNDGSKFEYYNNARKYFDNLSIRLKIVYSKEELWYIYKYDTQLSSLLKNIW
jgi:hypothetical protein